MADLKEQIADKQGDYTEISRRIQNYDKGKKSLDNLVWKLDTSPEYTLPEPQGLISAKSYKTKFADPLIKKLKHLVITVWKKYFDMADICYRLRNSNGRYSRENERLERDNQYLIAKNAELKEENRQLRAENKDFALLRKMLGKERVDDLVSEAREMQQRRKRNRGYERG